MFLGSRREDVLEQLGIDLGFLSGLFYTSWVCRPRQSGFLHLLGVPPTAIGSIGCAAHGNRVVRRIIK